MIERQAGAAWQASTEEEILPQLKTTIVAFQWPHAFNARSRQESLFSIGVFSNRRLLAGIGAAVVPRVAAIHTASGRMVLGTASLSWQGWVLIVHLDCGRTDEEVERLRGAFGSPARSAHGRRTETAGNQTRGFDGGMIVPAVLSLRSIRRPCRRLRRGGRVPGARRLCGSPAPG